MENLILFLATTLAMRRLSAPRKFKNCFIGDTGCSALLMKGDEGFDTARTRSGDQLYFHQTAEKEVTYGMIFIRLNQSHDLDTASDLMHVFIRKLKKPFGVKHNLGLQQDADWNNTFSASLSDYWQDGNGMDWKIKGYTDGRHMAVLYVKNISQADVNKQEVFLDSFHFSPAA